MDAREGQSISRQGTFHFQPVQRAGSQVIKNGSEPVVLVTGLLRPFVDLLVARLSENGISAVGAITGEEAQRLVDTREPAVIVAHPYTPGLEELIAHVRASLAPPPIVSFDTTDRQIATVFDLLLPASVSIGDLVAAVNKYVDARPKPQGTRFKILIVDDEVAILQILSEFFTGRGYEIITAQTGNACLELIAQRDDIHLVLLDLKLPGAGGMEALRAIKESKPHIAVIMLTSVMDKHVAQQALKLGAFEYMLKPVNLFRLEASVSACLSTSELKDKTRWWQ